MTVAAQGPTHVEVTAELVRELLRDQHPDLAVGPLELAARGWDNQLWRLGDHLAVRLPWAGAGAGELLRKEYTWVPRLAPQLPLPVPVPQRLGEPSNRFPHPWIVTTWVPGTPADVAPITHGATSADALASFLAALHRPAPTAAPAGRGRGGPLGPSSAYVAGQLATLTTSGLLPDPDPLHAVWDDAVSAPPWPGPPVWLHADLHPANLLTTDGTLTAVVDFGDLCAGDPAWDLAAAWGLPGDAVDHFHDAYAAAGGLLDAATRRRARGCALARALAMLTIADNGIHQRPGGKPTWGPPARATLRRLVAGT